MKVRVTMPGSYMVVEMEEEQAHRIFRKIVELLCVSGSRNTIGKEPVRTEPSVLQPELLPPAPIFVPKVEEEPVLEGLEETESETEEPVIQNISIGYGGFLYIKCPDCGKIKGFCAKVRLSNYRCDCGSVTRLENMVPLTMNCECGRNSRYLTNMEDPEFDITCYDCGSPVAVAWNPKKKQYETIRG